MLHMREYFEDIKREQNALSVDVYSLMLTKIDYRSCGDQDVKIDPRCDKATAENVMSQEAKVSKRKTIYTLRL